MTHSDTEARLTLNSKTGLKRTCGLGSLQFRVFRSCCIDDRRCGVGVFPQRKKIVVGAFRLHRVARKRERSCQVQACHRVHGINEHDTSMIENPPEFGGGFCRLMCREVQSGRERKWDTGRRSVR